MTIDVPRGLTRRHALAAGAAALAYAGAKPFAWAAGKSGLHGLSIFGEFKYPPDFKQFDWVNAKAPKGGRFAFQPSNWNYNQNTETFNTLNSYVLGGDSPPRMGLVFDSLMTGSPDEADTIYGLVAESVSVSDDLNVFTFSLRRQARFHDGSPLTAEDVAFSLNLLKEKGHPNIQQPLGPMAKAQATDAATLVVTLDGKQNRETILTIGGLPIFSKAFYSGRPFDSAGLVVPLGSGPYRVGEFNAPTFVDFRRVPDYWGKDLPVNVGLNNFDVIRVDFYRDRTPAFEAFKKGDTTYREEYTARVWANDYNFPAVADKRVKQSLFPQELVAAHQGFFFNTRRPKLGDPRTRQALASVFDFEWTNRNIFFGQYERTVSYFGNSDFAAVGKPTPAELALLTPLRADLAPGVLTDDAYVPPKTDGSGADRNVLRLASQLLTEAGWKLDGTRMVDARGAPLEVEILSNTVTFDPILTPYIENLKRIGVTAAIRLVENSQYQARLRDFDFDVTTSAMTIGATPLDGQPQLFGSKAADTPGSHNTAGVKDKAVDALLDKLPSVSTRAELVAVLRSVDRVLRSKHYWMPNWNSANHRVAHWDLFAWSKKPDYAFSPEVMWWFDSAKAAAAGKPSG
ncbi:MAG: extracellular solute-binding protein [Bauldia sp.]